MGYCYIWEFVVPRESVERFTKEYGRDGSWDLLFRRSPAFVRTELLRDQADASRFLTVDYWRSEEGYRSFMRELQSEYDALDEALTGLATEERLIGHFSH